jgi:hypothetical protein
MRRSVPEARRIKSNNPVDCWRRRLDGADRLFLRQQKSKRASSPAP